MGFYNTKFHVKQHDRLTHVLWEGGPRVHKHNLYVYATLLHFTLWDFMLLCIYIPFGGIRIKKLKPPQKRKDNNDKTTNRSQSKKFRYD
jgi:hypothetical protein